MSGLIISSAAMKCFGCGEEGHIAKICPLQAAASAAAVEPGQVSGSLCGSREPTAAVPCAAPHLGVSIAAEVGAGREDETGKVSVVGSTQDVETGQKKNGQTIVPIQSNDNGLTSEQAVVGTLSKKNPRRSSKQNNDVGAKVSRQTGRGAESTDSNLSHSLGPVSSDG